MKTINNVVPFLARFFYHVIYEIFGFLTASQSYFEIILINAFQAGHTTSGVQCTLGTWQLPLSPTGSLQAPALHSRRGLPTNSPPLRRGARPVSSGDAGGECWISKSNVSKFRYL